jgi:hypothetical protein
MRHDRLRHRTTAVDSNLGPAGLRGNNGEVSFMHSHTIRLGGFAALTIAAPLRFNNFTPFHEGVVACTGAVPV